MTAISTTSSFLSPLPWRFRLWLWGGTSSGKRCAGCLQPIPPHDFEYEADLAGQTLYFHTECHRIWLEECADGPAVAR